MAVSNFSAVPPYAGVLVTTTGKATPKSDGTEGLAIYTIAADGTGAPVATYTPITPATATATNGVMIGAVYSSTDPTFTNTQQGALQVGSRGALKVQLMSADGTAALGVAASSSDGVSTGTSTIITRSLTYGYNATGWDRTKGDANGLASSPHAIASARWNYAGVTGGLTDTSDTVVMAAGGASVRNYMTAIQYLNTAAVASEIVVKDGSTVIWRGYAPASMTVPCVVPFAAPLRGTANTAMNVAMVTTATATRVSAQGYQGV